MQSVRFALRGLARRPAFAGIAILTLALGIGANAAIFSVIDAALLRPLPYPDARRIVVPWEQSADIQQRLGLDRLPSSPADYSDFLERNRSFESFASVRSDRVNLTDEGDPERLGAVRVTGQFFEVLGVRAEVGRTFVPADAAGGRTIMIAHSLWQRRFGSDPNISGRSVLINGEPATIAGVLPSWFGFPAAGELPEGLGFSTSPVVWTLDVITPEQRRNRGGKSRALIGRLKPGVTMEQAEQDLDDIAADIARESPRSNEGWTVRVISLQEQLVGRVRPALMVVLTAVGLVLFIACANVANLLLVRATTRQRELTVRFALGGTRRQLMGQLLIESVVLAVLAGFAGLAVAWWTLRLLAGTVPANLPALDGASIDLRVGLFTVVVSLLTGFVFGFGPAFQATRGDMAEALRDGARGTIGGRRAHRGRNTLVVLEVALAALMLVGAALLVQTFIQLTRVDAGFRSDNVLTLEIALSQSSYPGRASVSFFERLLARLAALPGVEAVGATSGLPLGGQEHLSMVTIEGAPKVAPGQEIVSDQRIVTPGYFAALDIPLRGGSVLPDLVAADGPRVAMINETMARRFWPNNDALGRRIKLVAYEQNAPWHTIIGVVGDTRQSGLDIALRPQVYVHHAQEPNDQMAVVLKVAGDVLSVAAPARAAVFAIDPKQPVARVRTMQDVIRASVATRRFNMFVVATYAGLAGTLALVGLYAVVAYSVAERVVEMGVRLALGAQPSDLLRLVLTDGLKLVAAGLSIGLVAAFLLTRFLETMLFGVDAQDPATFVIVPLVLLAAALLGCLIPALRAMRVNPATALRAE
jgi:putative ABC transport system permease protein